MEEDKQKMDKFFSLIGKKTADIGKQAVGGVQKGIKNIVEQTKQNLYDKRVEKYNPLFPDEFRSQNFHIPNVIRIVDDAVRRDVDICEGAIGWIECVKGVEILNLYDEWVEESGLQFIPMWQCDNIYCVDAFDRKKFINSNAIFAKASEEKMAELEHIAYSLGAKSCSVEIVETDKEVSGWSLNAKLKLPEVGVGAENSAKKSSSNSQQNRTFTQFKGFRKPQRPNLKWFIHDDNINGLIEMRLGKGRSVKSKVLELRGACCATMDKKTACAIDQLLEISGNMSMESKAIKEHSSVLIFEVQF